jgi:hypothetical protein
MSPLFIKHFVKSAGLMSSIGKSLITPSAWSPRAQAVGSYALSSGIAEGGNYMMEEMGSDAGTPGRILAHVAAHALIGGPLSTLRGRQQAFYARNPVTRAQEWSSPKFFKNVALKSTLIPAGDILINAAKGSSSAKDMLGTSSQAVSTLSENITGMKPGETPYDAAARRIVNSIFMPEAGSSVGATTPGSGNIVPEADLASQKAIQDFITKHPEQKDKVLSFKFLNDIPASVAKQVSERDIGNSVGAFGKVMKNTEDASKNVANASGNVADTSSPLGGLGQRLDSMADLMKPISNSFKMVQDNAKPIAIGLGTTAAAVGGYNLLRDYLNYNRIKAEREAKDKSRKVGANVWGNIIGTLAGGGLAYNNAVNTGLSGSEAILPVLIGGISGGAAGGGYVKGRANGMSKWEATKAMKGPIAMTLANDMYGAPLWANMKGNIQAQKDNHLAAIKSNSPAGEWSNKDIALGVGGGALTLGALAALYQGTRAAKSVADGQPLVNATTTNSVFTGAGGPENPNVGGKMYVTLPTKNPGDKETTIELPLENMPLSSALVNKLRRDTKRRLRTESDYRTVRKDAPENSDRIKQLMAVR